MFIVWGLADDKTMMEFRLSFLIQYLLLTTPIKYPHSIQKNVVNIVGISPNNESKVTVLRKFVKIIAGRNILSTTLDNVIVNSLLKIFWWVKSAPLLATAKAPNVAETTASIIVNIIIIIKWNFLTHLNLVYLLFLVFLINLNYSFLIITGGEIILKNQ